MSPCDRHSLLKFIAFCQNNILRAAIFSWLDLGAALGPEQFHAGKRKLKAQKPRRHISRLRVAWPLPSAQHLFLLLLLGLCRAQVHREPGRAKKQMPVLKHHQLESPCSLGRAGAAGQLPLAPGSVPQVGSRQAALSLVPVPVLRAHARHLDRPGCQSRCFPGEQGWSPQPRARDVPKSNRGAEGARSPALGNPSAAPSAV